MLKYKVTKEDDALLGEINLPASKRITNKVLTIKAIHRQDSSAKKESCTDQSAEELDFFDKEILPGGSKVNQGKSAVALRFVYHYLSIYKGEWIIAVSDKMQTEPIRKVVEFLANKGINISFVEITGFPPIKIIGKNLTGAISRIDASISCDYIMASLVLSPNLSEAASNSITANYASSPYIRQNIKLLRQLGINTHWNTDNILIENVYNDGSHVVVEGDWGNASYWYQMLTLSGSKELTIKGLKYDTYQEDSVIKELFEEFGIKTTAHDNDVILTKVKRKVKSFNHDFSNNYNLIPCFTVTCALLGIPFKIKGVNLGGRAPERATMLRDCLAQLGASVNATKEVNSETVTFDGKLDMPEKGKEVYIPAHLDHRLAMAFTPAALLGYKVVVENPTQVNTTYPSYWDNVKKLGFIVNPEA